MENRNILYYSRQSLRYNPIRPEIVTMGRGVGFTDKTLKDNYHFQEVDLHIERFLDQFDPNGVIFKEIPTNGEA